MTHTRVIALTSDGLPLFSFGSNINPLVFPGLGLLHATIASLEDSALNLNYIETPDSLTFFHLFSSSNQGVRLIFSQHISTPLSICQSIFSSLIKLYTLMISPKLLATPSLTPPQMERLKTCFAQSLPFLEFIFSTQIDLLPTLLSTRLCIPSSSFMSSEVRQEYLQINQQLNSFTGSNNCLFSFVFSCFSCLSSELSWPIVWFGSKSFWNLEGFSSLLLVIKSFLVIKQGGIFSSFQCSLYTKNFNYSVFVSKLQDFYLVNVFPSNSEPLCHEFADVISTNFDLAKFHNFLTHYKSLKTDTSEFVPVNSILSFTENNVNLFGNINLIELIRVNSKLLSIKNEFYIVLNEDSEQRFIQKRNENNSNYYLISISNEIPYYVNYELINSIAKIIDNKNVLLSKN
ncbi:hypothetical protein P9112_009262 [Eukaryota sp. TZLM1-RC]